MDHLNRPHTSNPPARTEGAALKQGDRAARASNRAESLGPVRATLYRAWLERSGALLESASLEPVTARHDATSPRARDAGGQAIHRVFEQIARENHSIALVDGPEALSYEQLNRSANSLAHHILDQGVEIEDVVAVFLPRSHRAITALLAILKAGAAYLSLSHRDPRIRTRSFLEDCGVKWILTSRELAGELPESGDARSMLLDPEASVWRSNETGNPSVGVGPESLAYVMYTSGSTGRPKGVEVTHHGVVRLVRDIDYAELGPERTILQLAPQSFDASTFEIWGALLNGGRLVCSPDELPDLEDLGKLIRNEGVDTLWLTSSLFNLIVDRSPEILRPVGQLLIGGEALSVPHVRRAYFHLPDTTIINGYGPTENTTFSTTFRIPREIPDTWTSIPIGTPIAGRSAYVLDDSGQPAAVGEIGEIFVGGEGIARGYRNDAAATASRFRRDPYSTVTGARIYRTGDLASVRPDGILEFNGRVDDQVKLRGFRIEPGEIESTLNEHPDVARSAVSLREDRPGEMRLAAYCVPKDANRLDIPELTRFLRDRLPGYMVPASINSLEKLPLLPSGKIDRRSLPAPHGSRPEAPETSRNATEETLVGIWQDVLGSETVGIHDDFFELGGHSMLAVQLVAAIEERMGEKLPLQTLLRLTTIADLAAVLDGPNHVPEPPTRTEETTRTCESLRPELGAPASVELPPAVYRRLLTYTAGWEGRRVRESSLLFGMNTGGSLQPLYWIFQGYEEFKTLAGCLGEDQPLYGMRSGHFVMDHRSDNYRALAAHYLAEIRAVQPRGPYMLGGNCQSASVAVEIAKQLQEQGEAVSLLCALDKSTPFCFEGRVALFFGHASPLNPYAKFHDPALGWHRLFPGGFTVDVVTGSHGDYFQSPRSIESFSTHLEKRIREAKAFPDAVVPRSAIRREPYSDSLYSARLSAPFSLSGHAGEKHVVPVTMHNAGSATWSSTRKSGIMLANHWLDRSGRPIEWLDGATRLERDLAAGEEVRLELEISLPRRSGSYILQLDMVEEGVTWFAGRGSPTASIKVTVAGGGFLSRLVPRTRSRPRA